MAIASPSTPTFSASFWCKRTVSTHPTRFPSTLSPTRTHHLPPRRFAISSRLNSSKSCGSVYPDNGGSGDFEHYELQHGFTGPVEQRRRGSPVYVKLPVDSVAEDGKVKRIKVLTASLRALVTAGVEGVVMEIWWGIVEREKPRVYNWGGYLDLVALARRCGLKVRAVLAFHQRGIGPGDPLCSVNSAVGILVSSACLESAMVKSMMHYCLCLSPKISLPQWVLEEIDKDPDIAYTDRFGRRNMEYISLGCDMFPVLKGRSPLQAYSDFMMNFRDSFRSLLGVVITGVQVGMGPAGELRYPSCPSQKLAWAWHTRELGEFQCYDKYMIASLNACAHDVGMRGWGYGGPIGSGNLMHDPENTEFFKSNGGSWNTPSGKFFLQWYSGMLLLHGERICREAKTIFQGTEVDTSAKVAGIHWHYGTQSHPSELTAGYYNTSRRDGYLPIARMLGRYGFGLCCSGFGMRDVEEKKTNPVSSPEGFLRQILLAARVCHIPIEGENSATFSGDESFEQVLKMSKFYTYGLESPTFSFNFMRMDRYLFEQHNWVRFTRFVRQLSGANIFRARLDFRGDVQPTSLSDVAKVRVAYTYC
ncbi:hypothetical protein SADUNF_Sadunf01G0067500 [Salix dunnii]|uniref:Beta-amylase n=1 Tax=Salix dunnii TaxID=1413687 RepID=A0A835TJI3_9ROSI|nr:hypothetical protein SADUNF_Sadunf01G0067500 [Salix dunnii]